MDDGWVLSTTLAIDLLPLQLCSQPQFLMCCKLKKSELGLTLNLSSHSATPNHFVQNQPSEPERRRGCLPGVCLWMCPWKVALMAVVSVFSYSVFLFSHFLFSCATVALYGTRQRSESWNWPKIKLSVKKKKSRMSTFNMSKSLILVPCQPLKTSI